MIYDHITVIHFYIMTQTLDKLMKMIFPNCPAQFTRRSAAMLSRVVRYPKAVTPPWFFTAGPSSFICYQSCPGSFSFSLGGNCLSNSSAFPSSTKYPEGVAYSPMIPSRYPGMSSLHRKKDASSPSGKP